MNSSSERDLISLGLGIAQSNSCYRFARFGVPEDAAGLACFLASEAASWITGQVIVLDGGISSNYL